MKQKHTKGPWVIGNRYTDQGVYTPDGELVANTHGSQRNFNRDEQIAIQDANARLIAAAPELLEALEEFEAEYDKVDLAKAEPPELTAAVLAARAAIAKAKGEVG